MIVTVDISTDDSECPTSIAQDGPGDEYLIELPGLQLTVNYEQMRSIYTQLRGWFDDTEEAT